MSIELKNELNLLDLIEFVPTGFFALGPQTENVVIDMKEGIKKIGHYGGTIGDIYNSIYRGRTSDGTIFGTNDSILESVDDLKHSLEICKVTNLKIIRYSYTRIEGVDIKTTYKSKADFSYCGKYHSEYSVTDFEHENGKYDTIKDAYIVVSVSSKKYVPPYGYKSGYYKFVSAIYEV